MRRGALLVLLAGHAFGAVSEWRLVTAGAGGRFSDYFNVASLSRTVTGYRAWFLRDYRQPQTLSSGESYLSRKILLEFDCEEERVRSLASVIYSGYMGHGGVIDSWDGIKPWSEVESGSVGELKMEAICP